MKTCGNFS